MSKESELHRLEDFVEKLLARFSDLRAEKAQLEQDLLESEMMVEELRDNISVKDTERTEISQRVNRIVDQIEEWEQNLDDGAEAGDNSSEASLDENSVEEEGEEEGEEDDDGRVQHNLFSIASSKE